MYESLHDVEQKLFHSIILYDNTPVYVSKIGLIELDEGEVPTITLAPANQPTPKKLLGSFTVTVKDPKLNFRGISSRLGYINLPEDCIWVCRIAQRKSVQGINRENLHLPYIPASPRFAKPLTAIDFPTLTKSEAFTNMILGLYPSLSEAKARLDTASGVAFTRDLAVTCRDKAEPLGLEYKGYQIGSTEDCKTFTLWKQFHYLGEIVEHQGLDFTIRNKPDSAIAI